MKISEIINNPENRDVTASPPQSLPNDSPTQLITNNISQNTGAIIQGRKGEGDPPAMNATPVDNAAAMTGIETSTSLRRGSSFTAPNSSGDAFKLKAPTLLRSQSLSLPLASSSEMQSPIDFEQQKALLGQGNSSSQAVPSNISPTGLPPVTHQQNTRVRLRPDVDASAHLPIKRARRNTADQSAHSQSDHYPDSPNTSSSSDQGQWAGYPSQTRPPRQVNLPTEQTTILDQSGTSMINDPYIQQWKRDVSRNTSNTSLPHPASSAKGQTSSTGTFILPNQPRDGPSKTNSIYPEATVASISSAGSSAWHSVNGGSSFMSIPPSSATSASSTTSTSSTTSASSTDDPMSTPKFAQLPPPPSLRRPNPPKPLVPSGTNIKVQPPPPAFRRRTTGPPSATASELLDHPQIKAALQKHKELSWRSLQEQVGGSWEPRGEVKVMFGEGAPGSLMKRYSASEILDPVNWNRSQTQQTSLRGDETPSDSKRVWFQVRPEMKGASDATEFKDEPVHKQEIEGDTIMQDGEKASKERLISASKELMINQLFPKYVPYIPGLPSGAIYLRHDHDRFEFRPYGWGHREDEDGTGGYDSRDPQSMALIRTPSGTPGGRFIAPENRRLLQWSLAQARWLFVLNELPTRERPRTSGGYPLPDRVDSFLQQGEVVRRLDFDPNHIRQTGTETPGQWEWVLPIREKLWVSPMDEIVKKCGKIAAPVWDLGGRMLWDEVVGQWRFEVSPPTREVRETLTDKDGVGREVMYDVCEGGRPRISWNDFMGARDYLLILRRKITKLKAKARAQSAVRLPPSEALPPIGLEPPKIKKEEDLDSNLSDSGLDPDSSMMSTSSVTGMSSSGEKERQPPVLTDHGQKCASLLINMMMSVGKSPLPAAAAASLTSANASTSNKDNNAMSLDLGPTPRQPEDKLRLNVNLGKNNGFGEIGSASPSLSPTGSHVSAQRSVVSVEVVDEEAGDSTGS